MLKKRFSHNVLKLGGGTALGQALAVAATPIITRLYNPTDMGLLGIFLAFVGFACVGVTLRYEMPIVSTKDDLEADCLLISSIVLTLPVSLFAGLTLYIMIRNDILSYNLLPTWSATVAVLMLIFTGVFTSLRYWFVRQSRFDVVSRAVVFQGLGRAAVPIAFGMAQMGWIGLLLGEIASRILGIGRMLVIAWPTIRKSIFPDAHFFVSTLRKNWKSPVILLPSSLIDALSVMLPLPIITHLFGAKIAGEFFLVQRLINLPAGLIATSVADVFHNSAADTRWKEPEQLRNLMQRVTKKLIMISILIYGPIAIISPFIFGVILGNAWNSAGIYMTILAPLSITATVVSPVSRILFVVDKVEIKFIFDLISLIVPIFSFYVIHYLGYNFINCLIVYVTLNILAYLIYHLLIIKSVSKSNAYSNGI